MDMKILARLGAVALVGVVAVAAVAKFGSDDPTEANSRRLREQPTDPLGPMLVRCVELGEAALRDAGCRKTWMENRRRFLGHEPRIQDRPVPSLGTSGATKHVPPPSIKTDDDLPARPSVDSGLGAK